MIRFTYWVLPIVAALLTCCNKQTDPAEEKQHRVIAFYNTDGVLKFDYEGTGLRKQSYNSDHGKIVGFVGMHLDDPLNSDWKNPIYEDLHIKGSMITGHSSPHSLDADLAISTRVPLIIDFLGLQIKENPSTSFSFQPGKHTLTFTGEVMDFYEVRSAFSN